MIRLFTFLMLFSCFSQTVHAEWKVITHTDIDSKQQTRVAYTENHDKYSLEIYRDDNDAIRSRFSMHKNSNRLAKKNCPTFQVDKRELRNRSVNDAPCISHRQWVEFVLGYINEQKIVSTGLRNMLDGHVITYRFMLENGAFAETSFSLSGSKQTLNEILGDKLVIRAERGSAAN